MHNIIPIETDGEDNLECQLQDAFHDKSDNNVSMSMLWARTKHLDFMYDRAQHDITTLMINLHDSAKQQRKI